MVTCGLASVKIDIDLHSISENHLQHSNFLKGGMHHEPLTGARAHQSLLLRTI